MPEVARFFGITIRIFAEPPLRRGLAWTLIMFRDMSLGSPSLTSRCLTTDASRFTSPMAPSSSSTGVDRAWLPPSRPATRPARASRRVFSPPDANASISSSSEGTSSGLVSPPPSQTSSGTSCFRRPRSITWSRPLSGVVSLRGSGAYHGRSASWITLTKSSAWAPTRSRERKPRGLTERCSGLVVALQLLLAAEHQR